jgi:hypothetical protein
MKLKHYLGALLMAGSVVAISFPADANPGIRFCQRFCQRYAPRLVQHYAPPVAKSIEKTISNPNINRAISLIPRDQAKLITDEITRASKVLPRISTPNITSQSPQLASPPVVPTQPTGNEQEALKQQISRYGIPAGGTITVFSGAVVYLNSQNANSERTPIRSPLNQRIIEIIAFLM